MDYDLTLGDRLELTIGGRCCVSDVQELTKRGRLVISAPMYRSVMAPLSEGELFQVSYYRTGGMFSFLAKVMRRYRDAGLDLVEVDFKSPISQYQRREFIRLDTSIPVSVRLVALPEHIAERPVDEVLRMLYDQRYVGVPRPFLAGEEIFPCRTADLSGGGASFNSREKFRLGSLLECTFRLHQDCEVTADGLVVRAEEGVGRPAVWRVSVRFVNIEEHIRRKFIKYIYDAAEREEPA